MKIKIFILLLLVGIAILSSAQRQGDTSYTYIPYDDNWASAENATTTGTSWYWGSLEGYVFTEIMGMWRDKRNHERVREEAIAKLDILRRTWREATQYPAKITDGWHNAIATDNVNYYRVAQVFVRNNRPKKFVIDNYLPVPFMAANEIKNGKITVTIDQAGTESPQIVELYFLYDLDEPVPVREPEHCGYVCFWTEKPGYKNIVFTLDGQKMRKPFTKRLTGNEPCFTEGMVCKILKPGLHTFDAEFKGPGRKRKTIEIRKDMCLHYRL